MIGVISIALLSFAGLFSRASSNKERVADVWVVYACCIGLTIVTFCHIAFLNFAGHAQSPFPRFLVGVKYLPILDLAPLYAHTSQMVSLTAEGLSIVETLLLCVLVFYGRGVQWSRTCIVLLSVLAFVLIGCSLLATGLLSSDMYAYVGYARLGFSCYAPTISSVDRVGDLISALWGKPMLACGYGPLWISMTHILLPIFRSIEAQVFLLRSISIISFAVVIGSLVALKKSPIVVLACVLNPALWIQIAVDGHNDIFGLALIFLGMLCVRRGFLIGAVILACAAILSKLTLIFVAPLVFFELLSLRQRLSFSIGTAVVGVVASYALVGPVYVTAIEKIVREYSGLQSVSFLIRFGTLCCCAAVALAVCWRRVRVCSAFSFSATAAVLFPWYVVLALPYLALCGESAAWVLSFFPMLTFALATNFSETWAWMPYVEIVGGASMITAFVSVFGWSVLRPPTQKKNARV